jgi:hypothetical protein
MFMFSAYNEFSWGHQGAVHVLTEWTAYHHFFKVCESDLHCILLYPARSQSFISNLADLQNGPINSEGYTDANGWKQNATHNELIDENMTADLQFYKCLKLMALWLISWKWDWESQLSG